MGGLSKKAYQVGKLRQQLPATVLVDGGNLLFEHLPLAPARRAQEKRTATAIMAAYRLMGYDAVGIGRYDLAAGPGFLLEHREDLPWVSANIRQGGRPVFSPYRTVEVGGITVGILGITGPAVKRMLAPGYTLASWQEALPGLVAELAKRCDMVILLSSYPPQDNRAIAERFPEIHLVVQAGGPPGNRIAAPVNNTIVAQTLSQGKHLGVLVAEWRPSRRWQPANIRALLRDKRAALDRYQWQIDRLQAAAGGTGASRPAPSGRLKAIRDKLAAEVESLEATLAQDATSPPCRYQARTIALETTMPDDPRVLDIIQELKEDISRINAPAGAAATGAGGPRSPRQQGYIGWRGCTACHQEITGRWQRTRHAQAYDTLADRGRQFDLDCLSCHVTGIGSGDEPYALTLPEDLLAVGCEACHGPGRDHARDPAANRPALPSATVCQRCHTPEQDDNFDYQRKRRLVH